MTLYSCICHKNGISSLIFPIFYVIMTLVICMELLSNTLRPERLEDVIGQTHLVGVDKILTTMVKNKKIFSFIDTNSIFIKNQ